ncbi:MAG: transglutaminase-like domain-containing protein [Myxococcota bacterium]|nr:transglutaminase-like domain-containing protein [Myxococcota bacterium]
MERQIFETLNGSWTASAGKEIEFEITVDLAKESTRASIPRGYRESQKDRLLSVPDSLSPRVRQLAKQLTEDRMTELEKVRAVLAHFDSGFTYSLEPLEGEHDDPLVRFLFEGKKGHCELYAGAVAILLRLSGVQARIASGYYGGHYNEIGNYLGFTGGDAHAWVEAYIPEKGWRWFDATPADMRQRSNKRDLATVISDIYDTLNRLWYDNVIDYESKHNVVSVAIRAAKYARAWSRGENESASFFSEESEKSTRFLLLLPVALFLSICSLVYILLRRRRRQLQYIGLKLRLLLGGAKYSSDTLEVLLSNVPLSAKPLATEIVSEYQQVRFNQSLPRTEFRAKRRRLAERVEKLRKALENA